MFFLNIAENTTVMTTIIRSGFSTLQIYPRTLRRYFSLMSRLTSSTSRSQYFRNVRIRFFHLLPICSSPPLLAYCFLSWLSSTLRSTLITGQADRFISVTSSPYIITVPDLDW